MCDSKSAANPSAKYEKDVRWKSPFQVKGNTLKKQHTAVIISTD